jgi:hypothetical protein
MCGRGIYASGSNQGEVVGYLEFSNDHTGATNCGKYHDYFRKTLLLKSFLLCGVR